MAHVDVSGSATASSVLGVLAMSQFVDGTGFAGLQQNQELMGAWTIELLVSRINHQDFGISENPRIEMVESRWIDGPSLRAQPAAAQLAAVVA